MLSDLAKGPGMMLLLFSQAGMPPFEKPQDITPLQREVLGRAMEIQEAAANKPR